MTIEELAEICRSSFLSKVLPKAVKNAFDVFEMENKITPKIMWTKVNDVYLTQVGKSTICVGTFATETGYSIQCTGLYPEGLSLYVTDNEYDTAAICMDAVENAIF